MILLPREKRPIWITGNKRFCLYKLDGLRFKLKFGNLDYNNTWEFILTRKPGNIIRTGQIIPSFKYNIVVYTASNEECRELIEYFLKLGFKIKDINYKNYNINKMYLDPLDEKSLNKLLPMSLSCLCNFSVELTKENIQKFLKSIIDLSGLGYKTMYNTEKARIII